MITDKYSDTEILDAAEIIIDCIDSGILHNVDLKSLDMSNDKSKSLCSLINIIHGRELLLNINGNRVSIDRGISQAVKHLSDLGIVTLYSCEGHYIQEPYIMIKGIVSFTLESLTLEYSILRDYTIIRGSLGFDDLDSLDKLIDFNYKVMSLSEDSFTYGLCNSHLSDYNRLELDVLNYISGSNILPNISGIFINRINGDLHYCKESLLHRFIGCSDRIDNLFYYIDSEKQKMNLF